MLKIKPVLTEKSLSDAKKGKYTFEVPSLDKYQIKEKVEKVFGVTVVSVKTQNKKALVRKNIRGKKVNEQSVKKAIVEVKSGDKIALFGVEEKKK